MNFFSFSHVFFSFQIHMGDPYALAYVRNFPVSHDYDSHAGPSPFNAVFKIPEIHNRGLFKSDIWLTKGDILQLNHFEPRGRLQVMHVTAYFCSRSWTASDHPTVYYALQSVD